MKLTTVAVILASFISTSAFAMPTTSLIALKGGKIAPNDALTISLDKVPKYNYKVSCTITDPNYAVNPAWVAISGVSDLIANLGTINFNGNTIGTQAPLPAVTTTMEISKVNVASISGITIQNLDQDDSISVSNCTAFPVAN